VLVTGANGGIGRALVAAFRAEGAKVYATDRSFDGLDAEQFLSWRRQAVGRL
jgi:NAD(P)-dependent dehydrogenase (short-subunit alcohol dehydrogenase family)